MEKKIIISLSDIIVEFDGERILNNINLTIKDKEFVTLLGPSGCGKTTTLRIIGGFLTPNSGEIFFEDKCINNIPPYKREVNTVFQKYALFPHLNVYDNVAFGLKLKKLGKQEINKRVKEMLAIVDLKGYESRPISKLSGGQQQRVAIARALINHPKVLLLDEPLGALDLKLRKDMQIELKRIQQQLQTTFIYVTHDQEEALTMSDTVVVMKDGNIQQIGSPTDIYNEPANAFIADFIGEANIGDAVMLSDYNVSFIGSNLKCVDTGFLINEPVDIVIRPEDIEFTTKDMPYDYVGIVENVVFKGVHYEMTVDTNKYKWLVHSTKARSIGETVYISILPENIQIMKKMVDFTSNKVQAVVSNIGENDNDRIIKIEDFSYTLENANFEIDALLQLDIPPQDVEIVACGCGNFNAYVSSVIYKGSHNEIIVETDTRKWILNTQIDEQVDTYAGIKLNLSNAIISKLED